MTSSVIGLFILACAPAEPNLTVYATVEGEDILVEWEDVLLRQTDQDWDSTWTLLEAKDSTELNAESFELIAEGVPAQTDYVHLFADAKRIIGNDCEIDDIIEPIATPFYFSGSWRIDLTLIILDVDGQQQIFAKDSSVYKD